MLFFGAVDHCVTDVAGLGLRHDWGSQYRARAFQAEIKVARHPLDASDVGEARVQRRVERFIRTLKEECLYLNDFEMLEEAREV